MQKGFAPIYLLIGILILVGAVGGAYYFGLNQNRQTSQSISENANTESIPSSKDSQNSPNPLATSKSDVTQTKVNPPEQYGFTKVIDLPVIGVKAKFTEDSKASLNSNNYYSINSDLDIVAIFLENYDGGGRRAWFQKNHGSYADTFEPFSAPEHSGYIAYLKNGIDKDHKGFFYYFTAISSSQMLLVQGYNSISGDKYFGEDLNKFKSFISTVELTNKVISPNSEIKNSDLFKWSDNRKTLWEDSLLGLKITGSEWVDYRTTNGRNVDGSWNFTEWNRNYLVAKTFQSTFYARKVNNVSIQVGYGSTNFLSIFTENYQNQEFNDVVNDTLLPAGFCATEWKQSKNQCERSEYCYTKDEVIKSLQLIKSQKIGSLDAQLRSIDKNFDFQMDCRGNDTWLIKAKNGQFVASNIYPDSEILKLESF